MAGLQDLVHARQALYHWAPTHRKFSWSKTVLQDSNVRKHGSYVCQQWTWRRHGFPFKENRCFPHLRKLEAFHMHVFVISGASISEASISEVESSRPVRTTTSLHLQEKGKHSGRGSAPSALPARPCRNNINKHNNPASLLPSSRENLKIENHTLHKQRSFFKTHHLES